MPLIDPNKTTYGLTERLQGEKDPAIRRMLEEVRFHGATEAALNIEAALERLSPKAEYVLNSATAPPVVLRGVDEIRTGFYDVLVSNVEPRLEWDVYRCVVDGRTVITEGNLKVAMRGTALIQQGIKSADPKGFYLQAARHIVVWPFDEELRPIGETVFYGYSTPLEEVVKHRLDPERDIGYFTGEVILPAL
jgi:hypothetical protein